MLSSNLFEDFHFKDSDILFASKYPLEQNIENIMIMIYEILNMTKVPGVNTSIFLIHSHELLHPHAIFRKSKWPSKIF